MADEYLNIKSCPKCTNEHKYKLKVDRAVVLKYISPSDLYEQPRTVRMTRLFTCPITNADFQATFTLTDTSSDRIEAVNVVGVAKDEHA
jgi:hypothetical protein